MAIRRQAKQAHARTSGEVVGISAPAAVFVATVASGGAVGVAVYSAMLVVCL